MTQQQKESIEFLSHKEFKQDSYEKSFIDSMVFNMNTHFDIAMTDRQSLFLLQLCKKFHYPYQFGSFANTKGVVYVQAEADRDVAISKVLVLEGQLRILQEIMQEFAEATEEWLVENGNDRAKLALQLTEGE